MHQTSVVTYHAVSSHQHVVGYWVSEHFHTESVSDNFFSLLIKIGVDKSDVIVAGNTVTKSWEFLLNSDNFDIFGQAVPDISQFIIGGISGYEEAFFIAL